MDDFDFKNQRVLVIDDSSAMRKMLQITVQSLTQEVRQRLIEAGYEHREANTRDHVPLGEDDAPRLWAKFCFVQPAGQRRAHIHVRVAGNPNQRYPLLFRDYLRTHPEDAQRYAALKYTLAEKFREDREAYTEAKGPFIWEVLRKAGHWSQGVGWEPGPSDA